MARVLIVDDSTFARRKLKAVLTQAGHEVIAEASNGVNAIRDYERFKPDLVTMDVTMPIMDGVTAVKRIIEVFPDARIIMVSALTQRNMVLAALESGAKHYIIKQSTDEKIMEVVNKVLSDTGETRRQQNQNRTEVRQSDAFIRNDSQPFSIINRDGVFIMDVENIKQDNLMQLNIAVRGLLTVRPLKVVFDFGKIECLEDETAGRLVATMESIKNAGGDLKIVSNSGRIIQAIRSRSSSLLETYFSDASEIK